jgi:hypothetical protein
MKRNVLMPALKKDQSTNRDFFTRSHGRFTLFAQETMTCQPKMVLQQPLLQ